MDLAFRKKYGKAIFEWELSSFMELSDQPMKWQHRNTYDHTDRALLIKNHARDKLRSL